MHHLGFQHVNRGRQQLISFITSFAVAVTLVRFSAARYQQERSSAA